MPLTNVGNSLRRYTLAVLSHTWT